MESNRRIPIKNIYYMLSYAFQVLNEKGYKSVATEDFDNVGDLCAAILVRGMSIQIKRGLSRDYITREESLSALRGKLQITESVKRQTMLRKQMVCSYDDFSVDTYMNRIIKSTMLLLLRSGISKSRKKEIRKILVFLDEVGVLDVHTINWKLQYNRNNQTYQMLISICYMVIKGLLQTESDGTTKLMDFLDEQHEYQLYEKFVLEYYRKEFPQLHVNDDWLLWALDDNKRENLPGMHTDITLSYENTWLIIDTKYYEHTMREYNGYYTQHSDNMYQIFAYVKNKEAALEDKAHKVSGMLLYARTGEAVQPDNTYHMSGNRIDVRTLDLNCDFVLIQAQLNWIVKDFFRGSNKVKWRGHDQLDAKYLPPMPSVHAFALRWTEKFKDPNIDFIELVDHYMADECEVLGFEMDCGEAFGNKYGKAAFNLEGLTERIATENDIMLLGSAIYSQWRYYNHWAYDAREILQSENRAWFIAVLGRMAELSEAKEKVNAI